MCDHRIRGFRLQGMENHGKTETLILVSVVGSIIIGLSLLDLFLSGFDVRRQLIIIGSACEFSGVLIAALPDTADQIFRFLKRMWGGITNTAKRALRCLGAARVKLIAELETAKNLCRGLRGLPKNLTVRPGTAQMKIAGYAPEVRVSGAIEARIRRLEDEMAAMPKRWQADMRRLREQRVEFRLVGILLILIGVVLVAAGQLLG